MSVREYLELRGIKSQERDKGEIWFLCPFHEEDTPSCSINKTTEQWHCFGCNAGGSSLVSFEFALNREGKGLHPSTFKQISEKLVHEKNAELLSKPTILERLNKERLISESTIKQLSLGWDGARLWIPIYYQDKLINVKMWDVFRLNHIKYLWLGKKVDGYITNGVLYPYSNLAESDLLYTEGEGDCLAAISLGFPAITGGGTTFDFVTQLLQIRGKKLSLCFDNDGPGKAAQNQAINRLSSVHIQHRIISLSDLGAKDNDDLTKFFVHDTEKNITNFKSFLEKTPYTTGQEQSPKDHILLGSALLAQHYNHTVQFSAFVTAVDEAGPRNIAQKITLTKKGLEGRGNTVNINAAFQPEDAVNLFHCNRNNETVALKRMFGLGKEDKVSVVDTQNVLALYVQQDYTYTDTDFGKAPNFIVQAFVRDVTIHPYKTYDFTAKVIRNPIDNKTCFFIIKSKTKVFHDKVLEEADLSWLSNFWLEQKL